MGRRLIGFTRARLPDELARQPRPERSGKQEDREESGCDKATHALLREVPAPSLGPLTSVGP